MHQEIYHYTSGKHLPQILESGVLRVSEWERRNKVKPPALWLSLNPLWENTATKMISNGGIPKRLTKEEQYEISGLFRFVIIFQKNILCSWARYKHASNTPSNIFKNMEDVGVQLNANPKEWYASFNDIPLSKCLRIERWDGEKWIQYEK